MRPLETPNTADGTLVLRIRDAGVASLLCDAAAMAAWADLRAARTVRSIADVATALGATEIEAQRAVERLVDAGLVSVRRARGRRRSVGFVARYRSLVVSHEPEEDVDLVERVMAAMADAARAAPRGFGEPAATGGPEAPRIHHGVGRFVAAAPLDPAAHAELHRRIMDVVLYMRSLGMMALPPAPDRAPPRDTASIRVVIDLTLLGHVPSPHSSVALLPRNALDAPAGGARGRHGGRDGLTPREWDVAAAIAAGGSRPEIAHRLGISANTVASITKSVYRKLGVHSRLQVADRLRGVRR